MGVGKTHLGCHAPFQHSGPKWIKSAENKLTRRDFTNFSIKIQHIYIISVSGQFIHIIFKICQIAVGITNINQFHEFLFV